VIAAYWCDVGNLLEYRHAQKDVLDRKIRLSLPGRQVKPRVWVGEGTVIERDVAIEAPCLIGRNGRIGRGSRIGAYTVIGNDARIGKHATLRHSILWNNVRVGDGVNLENCVISDDTRVSESIAIHEGTIIQLT
jgi:mannose-1-phosphate guanylyltransferase/phosphomannomutase